MAQKESKGERVSNMSIVYSFPIGIEPTFKKINSGSPGAGFIPIITFNVLN